MMLFKAWLVPVAVRWALRADSLSLRQNQREANELPTSRHSQAFFDVPKAIQAGDAPEAQRDPLSKQTSEVRRNAASAFRTEVVAAAVFQS
jgi:hypothetical protein